MALGAFLITMIVAPALAMDYMVGDNWGWNRGVNYTWWPEGKDFRVGDSIMFMYTPGVHSVIKVNAAEFQQCTYSNATAKIFTSGNDVIPLATPGKKWYFSGIDDDCSGGMKLVITVLASEGTAPAPGPILGSPAPPPGTSVAGKVSALRSCVWMLAVMAAYRMIVA